MKRRILILNERDPANPLAGGAEVHVFEIFKRLAARGHEVTHLAAAFPGGRSEETVDGIRVRRLANRYLYYALVAREARREAARGCDVVVDVLNKLPFLSPWLVGRPCFCIVHHLFGSTAFRQVAPPIALVTYLSELMIPRAYRGVPMLAISSSTKDDLVERGLDPARIWVVPPGVDRKAYRLPDEGGAAPGAPGGGGVGRVPGGAGAIGAVGGGGPIVLWIGRLEPYKRADVAIEAMMEIRARVPDARLVIVGSGSARGPLEAAARERDLGDAVEFTGFVSESEKISLLQRAAVVVQTSEKEGWGMTVIEGNACGTPSVATNVPGLRDSVRDGETGLLVAYGDPQGLAAAVVRILTDEPLSQRLTDGGLSWAARFAWDEVADATEALIEEAIAPTGRPPLPSDSPFVV